MVWKATIEIKIVLKWCQKKRKSTTVKNKANKQQKQHKTIFLPEDKIKLNKIHNYNDI